MVQKDLFGDEPEDVEIIWDRSLLKSAVQKAIRLREVERAVICAKGMLQKDLPDALRRLMVIVVEDVILHPEYDRILEIMRKKVKHTGSLEKEDKNFLLNLVADLAYCEVRDDFEHTNPDKGKVDIEDIKWDSMGVKEQKLVGALKYRSMVGGMKSDVGLLKTFTEVWYYRFSTGKMIADDLKKIYSVKHDYEWDAVPEVHKTDILLEAVDFHCSGMVYQLAARYSGLVKEVYPNCDVEGKLKEIVWRMRSGVNKKIQIGKGRVMDWFRDSERNVEEERERHEYIWERIRAKVADISVRHLEKQEEKRNNG